MQYGEGWGGMVRDGVVVFSMVRVGCSMVRVGCSMVRVGCSMVRDGVVVFSL